MEDVVFKIARLFKTALIMSGDLLEGLYAARELEVENMQLEKVLDDCADRETYDTQQMMRLETALTRYASRIMSLYARYPDSGKLDSTYHRACSLRDICTTCINGLIEAGVVEGRKRDN
jgi:hypothetical protein